MNRPRRRLTELTAYDVSGGDKEFSVHNFDGNDTLLIQAFHSSFTQSDCKIQLLDSLDGVNFTIVKDSGGNNVELVMIKTDSTTMLRVINFTSPFYKVKYVEGTGNTGTLDKLIIQEV